MYNILTAKESLELSINKNGLKDKITYLDKNIRQQIEYGRTSFVCYNRFDNIIVSYLKTLGYKVLEEAIPREMTIISWDK